MDEIDGKPAIPPEESVDKITESAIEAVGQPNPGGNPKDKSPSSIFLTIVDWAILLLGLGVLTSLQQYLIDVGVHISPRWVNLAGLLMCELAVAHALFRWVEKRRWWPWVGLAVIAISEAGILFEVPPKPDTTSTEPAPMPVRPIDFVDGTQVTHKQLRDRFEFGYVIFSTTDGRWTFDPRPTGKAEWKVDWSGVKISPNFSNRSVSWLIPNFSYNSSTLVVGATGGINFGTEVPMVVGRAYLSTPVVKSNEPMPHFATLSDNQVSPVFLIGFRIPTDAELEEARSQKN